MRISAERNKNKSHLLSFSYSRLHPSRYKLVKILFPTSPTPKKPVQFLFLIIPRRTNIWKSRISLSKVIKQPYESPDFVRSAQFSDHIPLVFRYFWQFYCCHQWMQRLARICHTLKCNIHIVGAKRFLPTCCRCQNFFTNMLSDPRLTSLRRIICFIVFGVFSE